MVDPSAYYLSLGIDVSEPGEIKLERDLVTSSMPLAPEGGWGTVTATYRSSTHLWIGTSIGICFFIERLETTSWTEGLVFHADQILYMISLKLKTHLRWQPLFICNKGAY